MRWPLGNEEVQKLAIYQLANNHPKLSFYIFCHFFPSKAPPIGVEMKWLLWCRAGILWFDLLLFHSLIFFFSHYFLESLSSMISTEALWAKSTVFDVWHRALSGRQLSEERTGTVFKNYFCCFADGQRNLTARCSFLKVSHYSIKWNWNWYLNMNISLLCWFNGRLCVFLFFSFFLICRL